MLPATAMCGYRAWFRNAIAQPRFLGSSSLTTRPSMAIVPSEIVSSLDLLDDGGGPLIRKGGAAPE